MYVIKLCEPYFIYFPVECNVGDGYNFVQYVILVKENNSAIN